MRKHWVTAALVGVAIFTLQATASAQQPGTPNQPPGTPPPLPGTLTQQPGTIVEMVLKPCLPGIPRNQCGITLKLVHGSATFTTANGQTISLSSENQVVSIDGNGAVTQTTQLGTILNFAATGNITTAAIGGGGGGTVGDPGQNGGGNGGSNNNGNNGGNNNGGPPNITGGTGGGGGTTTNVTP